MSLLSIRLVCYSTFHASSLFQSVMPDFRPISCAVGWRMKRSKCRRQNENVQLNLYDHSLNPSSPFKIVRRKTKSMLGRINIVSALLLDNEQISEEDPGRFWNGPLPGDLSEVEAFCRVFRLSEQLHNAVMDALNSFNSSRRNEATSLDNKDGMAFENSQFSDGDDIPLLEQKVVAGLGCIGALLHQHKQEVLSGRVRRTIASHGLDDSIPPLACFRAEMKRCCKQLEAALSCYFPPVDEQSISIHRRFQRLINVCYDVGYPRPEGSPNHADIPNWAAVRPWPVRGGRNLETEEEIAFWRGGQITEGGLNWLLEKGFKMIVDLRAEDGMDQLAKAAITNAVSLGRLRLVMLPVEPGTAPTKEQVKEFAKLVADPESHPLYLQSQEGAGRTSAMVSRWRELIIRKGPQVVVDLSSKTDDNFFLKRKKQEYIKSVLDNGADTATMNERFDQVLDEDVKDHPNIVTDASNITDVFLNEDSSSINHFPENHLSESRREDSCYERCDDTDDVIGLKNKREKEEKRSAQRPLNDRIRGTVNPFEAQRPRDILSKQAMSQFRRGRRVVPANFTCGSREKEAHTSASYSSQKMGSYRYGIIAGPAGRWGLAGPGIPRAGVSGEKLESDSEMHSQKHVGIYLNNQTSETSDEVVQNVKNLDVSDTELTGDQTNGSSLSSSQSSTNGPVFKLVGDESPDDDTDEPSVAGDMCASTTGVVRLQSRKKAEMYLVRTDGFSCTRERVKESTLAFTHPSTQQQMLMWKTAPKTVLLLKKLGNDLMAEAQQVATFLHYQEGINVVVEPEVHDYFARVPGFGFVQTFYNQDTSDLHERVDFVVCLGGDGVILHASNLFRNAVPPVVSFNLGSLGFLTAHPFEDFNQDLRAIIYGKNRVEGVYITLRMRLRCELFRDGKSIPGKVFDVLNEVVVDRGSNPYLCKIECFERNRLITKVQADGVIVATPTGSTAYSTAAGGSMVHPNVPCMLFTPICPHSLSFRPVILPDSALLELKIPTDARSNAWVSFDGKRRQQLSKGDSVRICMSQHPLPTVNKSDQTDDWFCSLVRCLNWNERLEQRALTASFN